MDYHDQPVIRYRFDNSFRLSAWISKNSFLSGSISRNLPLVGSLPILPRMRQSTMSSKTMRSASPWTSCSLLPMYSRVMVRYECSTIVSFSFFMLKRSLSFTARYLSLLGRKLRLRQLRWNCSTSWRSYASMREISSWTSFSFLNGMEASWQSELYRESFLRAGLSMSRLIRTLVLRISLSSAELPYLAFSRKDSATYSALFSQLPLRNMPSAIASFNTDICPSFMQAAVSRVGIRSSISCSFWLMSQLVSCPYLISRLQSSICMLGVRASSFLLTKTNMSSASLRSFSSTAFSKSMKQDFTFSCGSSRAMKASTSDRICAQSADLSMPTMERMELSVYFSWELRSEMREIVDRSWSMRPFWLQMLSSWLSIFTLQFFSPFVSAVSYSFYRSSTALSNLPSRISDSISKYSSSTWVSTFCSSSSAWGSSSQTYSSSYSQSDMYPARVVIIYINRLLV